VRFAGQKINTDKFLNKVVFTLENRTGDEHPTSLWLSLPAGSSWSILQDGHKLGLTPTGNCDYPMRAELKIARQPGRIEITRETHR